MAAQPPVWYQNLMTEEYQEELFQYQDWRWHERELQKRIVELEAKKHKPKPRPLSSLDCFEEPFTLYEVVKVLGVSNDSIRVNIENKWDIQIPIEQIFYKHPEIAIPDQLALELGLEL